MAKVILICGSIGILIGTGLGMLTRGPPYNWDWDWAIIMFTLLSSIAGIVHLMEKKLNGQR
mgnify:CR=1 FL=1